MPFSKGHRPPREGREEVLDDVAVGVVVFKDPVGMPEGETELPVGTTEFEFVALDGVDVLSGALEVEAVELMEVTGGLETVPSVTLEVGRDD